MFRRLVLAALALMAVGVMSAAEAQRGDRWVLMGTREVDLVKGTESVDVSKAKGRVKAIRLEVDDNPIVLSRIQIIYNNSTLHNEDRRINLLSGERTKPIDLRGEERFVDQVNLVFERNAGDTWAFTILGDRLPLGVLVAAVYFGLGREHPWLGLAVFAVIFALFLWTSPNRWGVGIALHYLSRVQWPDPDDPVPPSGKGSSGPPSV